MTRQHITILGLGSLLSETSARQSCPDLYNFRLAKVSGYRRVFNKIDSALVCSGESPADSRKCACLSAVPTSDIASMIVTACEIPLSNWAGFVLREFEYRLVPVTYTELNDNNKGGEAVLCMGDYTTDEACEHIMYADAMRLQRWREFRAYYSGLMWRNDLLPKPSYLRFCLETARAYSHQIYHNFITTTFVADGRTIAEYIDSENDWK